MPIEWKLKEFDDLTPRELYAILQLRIEVFVVEQNCPFQDADDKDQASFHLLGEEGGRLVAYTRLVPRGVAYPDYPSIGRVVTSPSVRRSGAGRELMARSIDECYRLFGRQPIKIGAQCYLDRFYRSFGFEPIGEVYLEDGIEHIHMIKQVSS
jgi:ElaA protein